ncbi:MAG TPA: YqgE/AlgH family protein [Acidimicrobiales bacterium]|nr:YqgE/AlgH family protein [Acidimicrobiales bacterium]
MSASFTGRLLIAGPSLGDANFDRTIVYVLEHGPEGALGVIVNRPSDFPVGDALPLWTGAVGRPAVVFSGGPVEAGVALGLARVRDALDCPGWSGVDGTIGSVDLSMDPDSIAAGVEVARVFVGYAGWGAGQLDDEVGGGAWLVVEAEPDDLFTAEPEHLWGEVLRRDSAKRAMTGSNPSWN